MLQRDSDSGDLTFSVITPTLNRAHLLERALASVRNQSLPALEHIVVDGGSTDGTLELLAKHPDVIVLTGPDDGLYDAINKGIAASRGEVLVFLNDDDELAPQAIEVANETLKRHPGSDMVTGSVIVKGPDREPRLIGSLAFQILDPRAQVSGPNLFNGRFYRRELVNEVGPFNTNFRIASDTEFLACCLLAGRTTAVTAEPFYIYSAHSDSLTLSGNRNRFVAASNELLEIARRHLADAPDPAKFTYWRRWLWWRSFVLLVRAPSGPNLRNMLTVVSTQPRGFPDFLGQLRWHLRHRRERHGQTWKPGPTDSTTDTVLEQPDVKEID